MGKLVGWKRGITVDGYIDNQYNLNIVPIEDCAPLAAPVSPFQIAGNGLQKLPPFLADRNRVVPQRG